MRTIPDPDMAGLSREERRSITHGEFWIPEAERSAYRRALRTLNAAGVPFVVSGLYAIYEYTGIYRQTKDLDLMLEPTWVVPAGRALRENGFRVELSHAHWIAKAFHGGAMIDLVYGMGNGIEFVDRAWYEHSRPAILATTPVRVAPAEELIWHRLFISERHRSDVADVVHLFLTCGERLDWHRLLRRAADHWRLLLAQILLFDYVYPSRRDRVPAWVRRELTARAGAAVDTAADPEAPFRGTLVSRFSFAIDVNEWGFRDLRTEIVAAARSLPIVNEIRDSDVWQNDDDASHPAELEEASRGEP